MFTSLRSLSLKDPFWIPNSLFRKAPALKSLTISNANVVRHVLPLEFDLGHLEQLTFILHTFTPNEVLPTVWNAASTLRELELGYLSHVEMPPQIAQVIELPLLSKLTLNHSYREATIRHKSILTCLTAPKLVCLHVIGKMNTGEVHSVHEFVRASGCAAIIEELVDSTCFESWTEFITLLGSLASLGTLAVYDPGWRTGGMDPLLEVLCRKTEASLPRINRHEAVESSGITICLRLRRLELECVSVSSQSLEGMLRPRIHDRKGDDFNSKGSFPLEELVLRRIELDAGDSELRWLKKLKGQRLLRVSDSSAPWVSRSNNTGPNTFYRSV